MIGHKVKDARAGNLTRRCKAVGLEGPCRNWTEFEFCHVHEWKVNQAVMSTRQSFVLLFPRAVARLARLIDEPDGETALKAIMVTFKYMLGDKLATDGLGNTNELAGLTQEELIAKASRAIAALQQPSPFGGGSEQGIAAAPGAVAGPSAGATPPGAVAAAPAAAAAGPVAGLSLGPRTASDAAPGPQGAAAPGAANGPSETALGPSETAELTYGCA